MPDLNAHSPASLPFTRCSRAVPALFPLPHLASLSVSGQDARSFLHGQLTNDLKNLPLAGAQLSAWCSAKGRVIANFLIYARAGSANVDAGVKEESFRLICSASLAPVLPERLRRYVLRVKVALTDETDSIAHMGFSGATGSATSASGAPALAETLTRVGLPEIPAAPLAVTHREAFSLLRLPDNDRLILSAPHAMLAEIRRELETSLPAMSADLWQWLDVQYVLPWVSAETSEAFVPQMMNLEKLGGVSFTKGCYPGQEVVARTQHLGEIKRRLYRVESETALAAGNEWKLPAPEETDNLPAGKILQAAPTPDSRNYAALAVLPVLSIPQNDAPQFPAPISFAEPCS